MKKLLFLTLSFVFIFSNCLGGALRFDLGGSFSSFEAPAGVKVFQYASSLCNFPVKILNSFFDGAGMMKTTSGNTGKSGKEGPKRNSSCDFTILTQGSSLVKTSDIKQNVSPAAADLPGRQIGAVFGTGSVHHPPGPPVELLLLLMMMFVILPRSGLADALVMPFLGVSLPVLREVEGRVFYLSGDSAYFFDLIIKPLRGGKL
ncbi:MAG: hypothetical protein JW803_00140 [Endomicrobiales bacterium]|nr:hypothetical protein [Endomicrobiales bacterium]